MNYSMKSRIVAALLVGLSATTIGYAEEPDVYKRQKLQRIALNDMERIVIDQKKSPMPIH